MFGTRHETAADDPKLPAEGSLIDRIGAYFENGGKKDSFDPEDYEPQAGLERIPGYIAQPPLREPDSWQLPEYTDSPPVKTLQDIYKAAPAEIKHEYVFSGDMLEPAEIAAPNARVIKFEAAKLARQGTGLAVKAWRRGREISAAPLNLLEKASRFTSMRILSSLPSFESEEVEAPQAERTEEAGPESKVWYKKKKVVVGLGIVTLAAAAVGTAYLISKGYAPGGPSRLHEASNQFGDTKSPVQYPDILGNISPPTKAHQILTDHAEPLKNLVTQAPIHPHEVLHGANHAQAAAEQISASAHFANIKPGDGYTQALQNIFPNHDASTYSEAYKQALNQFGPGFLKGVHHYRMANGDWGLSGGGKAELTKPAFHMLSNFFGSHQ